MIALPPKSRREPAADLVLAIGISRPSPDLPDGYVSMTAYTKQQGSGKEPALMEDAADGPLDEATIEAVIRDLRSYVANGRKAFVNEIEPGDDPGHRSL